MAKPKFKFGGGSNQGVTKGGSTSVVTSFTPGMNPWTPISGK